MKETIKVGIGGYAFTCDADAYELLNNYLTNLKSYLQNKSDGAEIINDIEGRMSELLTLKGEPPGYIITLDDARDIIEIMGKPSDIVDEEDINIRQESTAKKKKVRPAGKKLYRDPENAIVGGVFSGLGFYFRIDPVILRIVYLLIMILLCWAFDTSGGLMILAYILLWIVVPKANTFDQKLAMTGKDASVQNIVSGSSARSNLRGSGAGNTLKTVLKVIVGILLFMVALFSLLMAFSAFVVPSFFDLPSAKYVLETIGLYSVSAVIALSAVWFIPAFMFIYLIVRLIKGFTLRDLAVLGIAFLAFIGAGLYLGVKGVNFAKDFRYKASYTEKFMPASDSDTLKIELDHMYRNSEGVFDSDEVYMINKNDTKFWFIVPTIWIEKDTIYKEIEIKIEKISFGRNLQMAEDKAKSKSFKIVNENSNIVISPNLYGTNNTWDGEVFLIRINCPIDKTIIVDKILLERTRTRMRLGDLKKENDAKKENSVEQDTIKNSTENDTLRIAVKKQIS